MFDRSGEMRLSSLGLLLIVTAIAMTLFVHPNVTDMSAEPIAAGKFGLSKQSR